MPTIKIADIELDEELVAAYADSTFWGDEFSHVNHPLFNNAHRTDLHNQILKAAGFDPEELKYPNEEDDAPKLKEFLNALEQYIKQYRPKAYHGD